MRFTECDHGCWSKRRASTRYAPHLDHLRDPVRYFVAGCDEDQRSLSRKNFLALLPTNARIASCERRTLRHVLAAGNDRSGNAITNVSGGELNERSRYRKCGLDRLDGPSTRPCGTDSDATHWRRMDAGCCRVVLRFGLLVLYLDPVCLLVELAFTWRAIALSAFRIIKPESIPRKTSSFVTS